MNNEWITCRWSCGALYQPSQRVAVAILMPKMAITIAVVMKAVRQASAGKT